jgi:hypothetical protein
LELGQPDARGASGGTWDRRAGPDGEVKE